MQAVPWSKYCGEHLVLEDDSVCKQYPLFAIQSVYTMIISGVSYQRTTLVAFSRTNELSRLSGLEEYLAHLILPSKMSVRYFNVLVHVIYRSIKEKKVK